MSILEVGSCLGFFVFVFSGVAQVKCMFGTEVGSYYQTDSGAMQVDSGQLAGCAW